MLLTATIAYVLLLLSIFPLCKSYFSSFTTVHLKTGKCGTTAGAAQLYDKVSDDHSITYWHVYTDSSGMSTQKKQCIKMRKLPFLDSVPALLVSDSIALESSKVKFLKLLPGALSIHGWLFYTFRCSNWHHLITATGRVIDWHENPVRQWIVPLSGRWFVETMDHLRVEMKAGDCLPVISIPPTKELRCHHAACTSI